MKLWTEMRTAMTVARHGTVRAAAKELGLHRATVTRHIDALENHLGVRLFLRHQRGYSLTKDGALLRRLSEETNRLLEQFADQAADTLDRLSGQIHISTYAGAIPLVAEGLQAFCAAYPDVIIKISADGGYARLELGQTSVAIRQGPKPDNPDYVVQPLRKDPAGLFGHRRYFESNSVPRTLSDLRTHHFVGVQPPGGVINVCDQYGVLPGQVRLVTPDPSIARAAMVAGLGLGILEVGDQLSDAAWTPVLAQPDHPRLTTWVLTHVDMHRSHLLKTFLPYLRTAAGRD